MFAGRKKTIGTTLDELRDIVAPIASRYNVRRVYLFGSRARGDYTKDSD
ncbi:MAG: nucleotidyltransferase domain-containing protein, partial [Candidatus Methanomethylophilaceae archaeon]|nr:nucleotidyltransferase domain-containing protein [Candidatus Methanomethylophilaceae archaeon]